MRGEFGDKARLQHIYDAVLEIESLFILIRTFQTLLLIR